MAGPYQILCVMKYDIVFKLMRDGKIPYIIMDDSFESHYKRKILRSVLAHVAATRHEQQTIYLPHGS